MSEEAKEWVVGLLAFLPIVILLQTFCKIFRCAREGSSVSIQINGEGKNSVLLQSMMVGMKE